MINTLQPEEVSAYHHFSRQQWQQFNTATLPYFSEQDLDRLSGVNEEVSRQEILDVYMPLACLLRLYIEHSAFLHGQTERFLQASMPKVPFEIGVAGSVASGKSTTSRILMQLLSELTTLSVQLVGTDGFLLPNAVLENRGLMERKGFPESYDLPALLQFLSALKSGQTDLSVPVYSHHQYDIVKDQVQAIGQVDVLIVEGLNILQTGASSVASQRVFVSDFLDFTVFVDASVQALRQWYLDRVLAFLRGPMQEPTAYFHHLTLLTEQEVMEYADQVWRDINEKNLFSNILPFRFRSDCILQKEQDHAVANILLRKL